MQKGELRLAVECEGTYVSYDHAAIIVLRVMVGYKVTDEARIFKHGRQESGSHVGYK